MKSLFISLVITFLIYFNFFTLSLAQEDLYDVDEAFYKRNNQIFEVKKDPSNQSIRDIRKSPPSKGNNKDSPYADEHFNFDTLAGIGLGKRSSSRYSKFGQARNSLQNHYGKLFFRTIPTSNNKLVEKRFLNMNDLDRAIGNRIIGKSTFGKKKTTFPFFWLN